MTNDWIEGLPVVKSDDPNVVNPDSGGTLSVALDNVQALNTEARAVFMLHSKAVRGQLLNNPKARNALDQFLWELAKDEELGIELCKRNPIRYSKLRQSPQDQSGPLEEE